MGVFEKLEKRLDKSVNSAFARAFRSTVQPVEIASAIRGSMDDTASRTKRGHQPVVPNVFTVYLSTEDHAQLTTDERKLADQLIAAAAEHAETQRYAARGPWAVMFELDSELETGVFRLRPSIAKDPASIDARTPEPEPDHQPEPGPQGLGAQYAAFQPPVAHTYDERIEDQSPFNAPQYTESGYQPGQFEDGAQYQHDYQNNDYQQTEYQHTDYQPTDYQPAGDYQQADHQQAYGAAPRHFQARPYLTIQGERYELGGALTVLGRDERADIIISDPGVSRRHTEIRVTNDGPHKVASVRDLGSTNGTYVNGDRVDAARLREGDRITIGRTSMTYGDGTSP